MSGYKNYFFGKVVGHSTLASVRNALEGLLLLKDQVFLQNEGKGYLMVDTEVIDTLKFNVVDYMGKKASVMKIVSAEMTETDDSSKTESIGSKFNLVNDGSQLTIKFDDIENMKWASYAIKF